jgi:hypothetical protein
MNFEGIIIGAASFLTIGIFHPLVIKAEYHFGTRIWPFFLIMGLILSIISLFVENIIFGTILGIISFCSFWCINELFRQKKRVEKGWFPKKPER